MSLERRRCNNIHYVGLLARNPHHSHGMETVVGIFPDRAVAERAMRAIAAAGIPRDKISVVFPGEHSLAGVPTTEAEPPGVGRVIGGVVGGAAGAATGLQAGALVSMLLPGVGPVVALGLLGAAAFGAAGAMIGDALDTTLREVSPRTTWWSTRMRFATGVA